MKIYTKSGDKGETSLGGGKRLKKNSLRVEAYGNVDELGAVLGVCRALNSDIFLGEILIHLQKDLFMMGADLAAPEAEKAGGKRIPRISEKNTAVLEKWIDGIDAQVKPLNNFILPGGEPMGAELHYARTVCRRAERTIVALDETGDENGKVAPAILAYINRLSDLLFMMARYANHVAGHEDEKWNG